MFGLIRTSLKYFAEGLELPTKTIEKDSLVPSNLARDDFRWSVPLCDEYISMADEVLQSTISAKTIHIDTLNTNF